MSIVIKNGTIVTADRVHKVGKLIGVAIETTGVLG